MTGHLITKKVLSLDLGITTGYAVIFFSWWSEDHLVEVNPTVVEYGDIHYDVYLPQLRALMLHNKVNYSVAERPVIIRGKLGNQLQEVIDHTSYILSRQVEFVDPTQWKSTPFKKHPTPPKISPHARDAIRLGVWYASGIISGLQGNK